MTKFSEFFHITEFDIFVSQVCFLSDVPFNFICDSN